MNFNSVRRALSENDMGGNASEKVLILLKVSIMHILYSIQHSNFNRQSAYFMECKQQFPLRNS